MVVFDAPVSWLKRSSGRASARVTWTRSSGTPSSSAISIAEEVVIPWPTSARGSAKLTVPSVPTSTVIRLAVGIAATVIMSLRSRISVGSGHGMPSATGLVAPASSARPSSAAATSVGAAST